jgi:hypothetical protein
VFQVCSSMVIFSVFPQMLEPPLARNLAALQPAFPNVVPAQAVPC